MKHLKHRPHVTPELLAVGQYLAEARAAAGLSQGDVAKQLEYTSAQFVSNWERGICFPPRVGALKTLASLYGEEAITKAKEMYVAALYKGLCRHWGLPHGE